MGSSCSSLNSNPLFSSIVSFYVLVFLYFPPQCAVFLFSPVFLCTILLLAAVLRLGSSQKCRIPTDQERETPVNSVKTDEEKSKGDDAIPRRSEVLVEWNRRAPLEVIYEEYEGEDQDDGGDGRNPAGCCLPGKFSDDASSLAMCYPDSSDSETSSEFDFPAGGNWEDYQRFEWEEERDEGLFEIPVRSVTDTCQSVGKVPPLYPVEEDNLIEIDLFDQTVVKNPRIPVGLPLAR